MDKKLIGSMLNMYKVFTLKQNLGSFEKVYLRATIKK
jgi:hypothetical protein